MSLVALPDVYVAGLLLSLAIGASLGLLGGGGSTLTVPVLHYVFGVEPHAAIAMSLVVVGVTSAVAMIPLALAGHVRWRTGLMFGVSSMASAFLGGRIGSNLPGTALMLAFAALMLVAGSVMLQRALRRSCAPAAPAQCGSVERIAILGVVVGLVTGILGAGGGFMIVPALTLVGGLEIADAVGTSLFVIVLNTLAGLAGTAGRSSLDLRLTMIVAAVAIVGSIVGARIGRRISARGLQRAFGAFVMAVGLFMIVKQVI